MVNPLIKPPVFKVPATQIAAEARKIVQATHKGDYAFYSRDSLQRVSPEQMPGHAVDDLMVSADGKNMLEPTSAQKFAARAMSEGPAGESVAKVKARAEKLVLAADSTAENHAKVSEQIQDAVLTNGALRRAGIDPVQHAASAKAATDAMAAALEPAIKDVRRYDPELKGLPPPEKSNLQKYGVPVTIAGGAGAAAVGTALVVDDMVEGEPANAIPAAEAASAPQAPGGVGAGNLGWEVSEAE
ncbi:MAG: hypothetical protein ACT4TC_10105 [Myxococcaceae bacterium]